MTTLEMCSFMSCSGSVGRTSYIPIKKVRTLRINVVLKKNNLSGLSIREDLLYDECIHCH